MPRTRRARSRRTATNANTGPRLRALLWVALAIQVAGASAADAKSCNQGVEMVVAKKDAAELRVHWKFQEEGKWKDVQSCSYDNAEGRIDERMRVTVKVDHFNFLHYGLKFDIEEEVVEAYAELADFWTKFFSPGTFASLLDIEQKKKFIAPECDLDSLLAQLKKESTPLPILALRLEWENRLDGLSGEKLAKAIETLKQLDEWKRFPFEGSSENNRAQIEAEVDRIKKLIRQQAKRCVRMDELLAERLEIEDQLASWRKLPESELQPKIDELSQSSAWKNFTFEGASARDKLEEIEREIARIKRLDFESISVAWRKILREAGARLAGSLRRYRHLGLEDDEIAEIGDLRLVNQLIVRLLELYKGAALEAAVDNKQLDRFEKTEAVHTTVLAAYARFGSRAKLVKEGAAHQIKKKKAGTIVSVKMTAKDLEGAGAAAEAAPKKEVVVDYFVQSKYPVLFHAGLAYSDVDEVEFAQVRTLADADLFSAVEDNKTDLDLLAFLSYQFWSLGKRSQQGLLGTVGTALDEPGKKVYLGVSYRRGRFLVTAGWVRAEVEEGQGMVADDGMTQEPQAGQLFETIRKGTDGGGFVALSVSVFSVK